SYAALSLRKCGTDFDLAAAKICRGSGELKDRFSLPTGTIATGFCWLPKQPGGLSPVWKRIDRSPTAGFHEFRNALPAAHDRFEKLFEGVVIAADPLRRQLTERAIEYLLREAADTFQPGLEVGYGTHVFVDHPARIQSGNRRIRQIPVRAVESESVVD